MRRLFPVLFSCFGFLGTVGLVLVMNEAPPKKQRDLAEHSVSFSIEREVAPVQRSPKPKPRSKPRKAPPPTPMLSTSLRGLSFGLEGLDQALDVQGDALLNVQENLVMTSETVDVPPRPIVRIAPFYPPRAQKKGIEGYVTLSLLITEDGTVEDVLLVESAPEGIFEASAEDAIQRWTFEPGKYKDAPVSVRITQVLRFTLG